MIAVVGFPLPILPPSPARSRDIQSAVCVSPARAASLRKAAQAQNRLDREIGVVRQVAGEIVGAELVLRVEALLPQVLAPTSSALGQ